MSGTISRSVSLLSPDTDLGLAGGLMNGASPPPPATSLKGDTAYSSPLQHFVQAKKNINDIFREIETFGRETERYLTGVTPLEDILPKETYQLAVEFGGKVSGIREVLERDHMKVAFFGRTSNGKSTAVNSLLGERILPMGIGHTTSCFLQVEGSQTGEAYLTTEGSGEHKSLQSLPQLGNALCAEKLEANSKVRILWPVERCRLLGEEVVIIDSPGIDVEADLDNWIDKFCLDSDVFVLVSNAESTIMLTEKKFFHKVSERLSNPNLFIVHNRWDASAGDDAQEQVRKQHTERAINFLTRELKICTKEEAEDRIFFISAKEALQTRLQEAKGLPPNIGTEDYFTRYLEFQRFEKQLEHCLSNTAVKTKFAAHTSRGKDIVTNFGSILSSVQENSTRRRGELATSRKELLDRLDFTERQLELMTCEMKDKICAIVEDVEYKVAKALSEEIRRLSVLVDEFNDPFHPDPLVVNVYKSKLNHHVESGVGSNLKSRLSTDLSQNMEVQQKEMMDRMTALLPTEKQTVSRNILPRREAFEILYHLNCDNLCSDFQEDLSFQFSLGFSCLLKRFLSPDPKKRRGMGSPHHHQYQCGVPRGLGPLTPDTPSNEFAFLPPDDWSLVSKIAIASLSSQGTMGGLLVGGLLLKTVGWRVLAISGLIYGSVYCYERLTWTNQAKLRVFKQQYVDHAARKLRLIVDMTSANCSHQVQQELSSTFARLCHLVDETTAEMREESKQIEKNVKELDEVASSAKKLRNEATFLKRKLDIFEDTYLK